MLGHRFELLLPWNFDLDFDLETDAELILDVLTAAKALEDASFHHDAHFSAQGLRFFHQMRREDHSTMHITRDLPDNFPHESPGFRVHSR